MLLTVDRLEKSFGEGAARQAVLHGVSLSLEAGESLAVTGESGSGKSTLLHLIGLLDRPDAGEIRLKGELISALDEAGRAARRRDTIGKKRGHVPILGPAPPLKPHASQFAVLTSGGQGRAAPGTG